MPIQAAFMVPHPPMIVPAVGRGSESQITATTRAYEQVASEIAALAPDTIIIASPHTVLYADYFHISPGKKATGSFAQFGAARISFKETYDAELASLIGDLADERGLAAGPLGERDRSLDHGAMVPLYFIRQKYDGFRIVRVGLSGLPLTDHYRLGQTIRDAVDQLGRRAVFIGSGDLSHKLQTYGPYGFAPEGPAYDERIMDVMGRAAFGELFDFEESFCDKAAECGHRSFVIMAGALDGLSVAAERLSHEDVTGVGYGICTFYPGEADSSRHFLDAYLSRTEAELAKARASEDPYVRLARLTLENYLCEHRSTEIPGDAAELAGVLYPEVIDPVSDPARQTIDPVSDPDRQAHEPGAASDSRCGILDSCRTLLKDKAGVFVSLHKHDRLRGCIGTIAPTTGSIAKEIVRNAVCAATEDPRFDPVTADELKWLDISVDVLGRPEPIDGPEELDVKRYGVIVTNGHRRGLLLPDLDGVDTVEEQIAIARRKAGIREKEPVRLERFEVIRHH